MSYRDDDLNEIYDRSGGYCHACGRKVAFTNYGVSGAHACWEVDHSKARANGGTNRRNNLYAACIPCNREKGTRSTRSVRRKNGMRRAPISQLRRREEKQQREALVTVGIVALILGVVAYSNQRKAAVQR